MVLSGTRFGLHIGTRHALRLSSAALGYASQHEPGDRDPMRPASPGQWRGSYCAPGDARDATSVSRQPTAAIPRTRTTVRNARMLELCICRRCERRSAETANGSRTREHPLIARSPKLRTLAVARPRTPLAPQPELHESRLRPELKRRPSPHPSASESL